MNAQDQPTLCSNVSWTKADVTGPAHSIKEKTLPNAERLAASLYSGLRCTERIGRHGVLDGVGAVVDSQQVQEAAVLFVALRRVPRALQDVAAACGLVTASNDGLAAGMLAVGRWGSLFRLWYRSAVPSPRIAEKCGTFPHSEVLCCTSERRWVRCKLRQSQDLNSVAATGFEPVTRGL